MTALSQDRLVRKEVALGTIREFELPQSHIGLREFAPFMDVQSDDVIFEYMLGLTDGLAPARAEDAEAEMARKDETMGEGRASIIDWSVKDHYTTSDVTRYRESIYLNGQLGNSLPLSVTSIKDGFEQVLARDTLLRRRKLDNRLEWLIQQALWTGAVSYNDGKIKFSVDYGRPSAQQNASVTTPFDDTGSDPIQEMLDVQEYMYDEKSVTITRAVCSRKVFRNLMKSSKFANDLIGSNPLYTVGGWGPEKAAMIVSEVTGIQFEIYDSVYRTRALGSETVTNTRFSPEDKILFLPSQSDIDAIDDMIGFGKTLTSPHVAGGWTPGYYEWEKDLGQDPWGYDVGNGIKAFPIFPHLDLTYVLKVLA
jgi:hypothetical protein